MRRNVSRLIMVAAFSIISATSAEAAYVVNMKILNSHLVATGSGSINTSSLNITNFTSNQGGYLQPHYAEIFFGTGPNALYKTSGVAGPTNFGPIGQFSASTTTGNAAGIFSLSNGTYIKVPVNYVSGSALGMSTDTFFNINAFPGFLTPGTYVWNWGSGASADKFTVNIGGVSAAVPEPSTWAMMLLGLGGVGVGLRRRRLRAGPAIVTG